MANNKRYFDDLFISLCSQYPCINYLDHYGRMSESLRAIRFANAAKEYEDDALLLSFRKLRKFSLVSFISSTSDISPKREMVPITSRKMPIGRHSRDGCTFTLNVDASMRKIRRTCDRRRKLNEVVLSYYKHIRSPQTWGLNSWLSTNIT